MPDKRKKDCRHSRVGQASKDLKQDHVSNDAVMPLAPILCAQGLFAHGQQATLSFEAGLHEKGFDRYAIGEFKKTFSFEKSKQAKSREWEKWKASWDNHIFLPREQLKIFKIVLKGRTVIAHELYKGRKALLQQEISQLKIEKRAAFVVDVLRKGTTELKKEFVADIDDLELLCAALHALYKQSYDRSHNPCDAIARIEKLPAPETEVGRQIKSMLIFRCYLLIERSFASHEKVITKRPRFEPESAVECSHEQSIKVEMLKGEVVGESDELVDQGWRLLKELESAELYRYQP